MQMVRWLACHGLTQEGLACDWEGCTGTWRRIDRKRGPRHDGRPALRCTSCERRRSARGEFFRHYMNLQEAFLIVFMLSQLWTPDQIRGELRITHTGRITAMLKHLGQIGKHYLELKYKSDLGKWEWGVGDEYAVGKAKRTRNGRAAPPTVQGLRWFFSFANVRQNVVAENKTTDYFTERILDNTRDTKALCWHVERLMAPGGTFVSDCHKGYAAIGVTIRPDVRHLDCNHSEGFGAPGPKSIALGITEITSNAAEGGHSRFLQIMKKLVRRLAPQHACAPRHHTSCFDRSELKVAVAGQTRKRLLAILW